MTTDPHVQNGRGHLPSRGTMRLLGDPVFGPFIIAKTVSVAGVWIYNIVAALVVYEISGSTFAVGLVTGVQWAPQMLAPVSGAIADRGDRKTQIVVGRVITGVGCAGIAGWIGAVGTDGLPGTWPVIAAAFVVGVGFLVGSPAMQSLVPSMVRPDELSAAMALDTLPMTVARAGGPAVGALVMAAFGPAAGFAIGAITQFAFAAVVAVLPIDGRSHHGSSGDRRIRAGFLHIWRDPVVAMLLVGIAAVGLGIDSPITLSPTLSESFGAGDTLVGVFVSSFGAGTALGFVVTSLIRNRTTPDRVGDVGLWLIGGGLSAVALNTGPLGVIIGFGIAGAGLTLSLTGVNTVIHERVPEVMRGRVMAVWLVAILGTRPVGAAMNGAIADLFSASAAAGTSALLIFGVAWLVRPARLRRMDEKLPDDALGASVTLP